MGSPHGHMDPKHGAPNGFLDSRARFLGTDLYSQQEPQPPQGARRVAQTGLQMWGTESRAHTKRQDSEENKDDFTSAEFVFQGKETMTMWIRHTLSPSGRV